MLLSGFRPCRYYYRRDECSHRLSPHLARYRAQCVVCVSTSSLSSLVINGFDTLPRSMRGLSSHVIAVIACYCPVSSHIATTIAVGNVHTDCPRIGPAIARDVWSVLARHRYRRLSSTGSTPRHARCVVLVRTSSLPSHVFVRFPVRRYYYGRGQYSHRLSPDCPRSRARCVVCLSTSSPSSLVIDGFDTLLRSMRSLSSHVIAVIACFCPVSRPVTTTIAVGNIHTDCPWIGPAIARNVWSLLARHHHRGLSLTPSTHCGVRARWVVCVSTSSLRSLVIDGFDTLQRSRAMCGRC